MRSWLDRAFVGLTAFSLASCHPQPTSSGATTKPVLPAVVNTTAPAGSEINLMHAVKQRDLDSVAIALDSGADPNGNGGEAILFATAIGTTEIVALLIDRGANVNVKDEHGNTPLFFAAGKCGTGSLPMVRAMIARGADVNARCIGGMTPLQQACMSGRPEVVGFLLASGADVSVTEKSEGDTALHIAADRAGSEHTRANLRIIDLLFGYGADVNAPNTGGKTPLDFLEQVSTHRSIVDPTVSAEIHEDFRAHHAKTGAQAAEDEGIFGIRNRMPGR